MTQAGLTLVNKSSTIFAEIEETVLSIKTDNQFSGELKIGAARTLAAFSLNKSIEKLKQKFPDLQIKVILHKSEKLIEMLESREIDVAIFFGDERLHGYKQIVIGRGSFCLLIPRKMKIENAMFAITERRPETERLKTLFERQYSKELPVFAEIPSWDAIWEWVNQGSCGGLIPDFLLQSGDISHLEIIFKKVFPYEIKIILPQSKSNHSPILTLINLIKQSNLN